MNAHNLPKLPHKLTESNQRYIERVMREERAPCMPPTVRPMTAAAYKPAHGGYPGTVRAL